MNINHPTHDTNNRTLPSKAEERAHTNVISSARRFDLANTMKAFEEHRRSPRTVASKGSILELDSIHLAKKRRMPKLKDIEDSDSESDFEEKDEISDFMTMSLQEEPKRNNKSAKMKAFWTEMKNSKEKRLEIRETISDVLGPDSLHLTRDRLENTNREAALSTCSATTMSSNDKRLETRETISDVLGPDSLHLTRSRLEITHREAALRTCSAITMSSNDNRLEIRETISDVLGPDSLHQTRNRLENTNREAALRTCSATTMSSNE